MDFPDHPFWDFALDVYRRPGVSEACLLLQEAHHLDVNLLLFCDWIGASGRGRLSDEDIAACRDAVAEWHDTVVRALRGVRRALKGGIGGAPADLSDALRKQIQAREIDAEHVEQIMLTMTVERVPDEHVSQEQRLSDAAANMLRYGQALSVRAGGEDRARLAIILGASFSTMTETQILQALNAVPAAAASRVRA